MARAEHRPLARRALVVNVLERTTAFMVAVAVVLRYHNPESIALYVGVYFSAAVVLLATTRGSRWQAHPLLLAVGLELLGMALSTVVTSRFTFAASSVLLSSTTIVLSFLFPQPALPPCTGPFNVGYIDVSRPADGGLAALSARILYPTLAPQEFKSYAPHHHVQTRAFVEFGAPAFIQRFLPFMLDFWHLVTVPSTFAAPLVSEETYSQQFGTSRSPVVIFSHGNGGSVEAYNAITTELASHGYVVVVLEHMDGSASLHRDPSGNLNKYDHSFGHLDSSSNEYVWRRRDQAVVRVNETLAAIHFAQFLDAQPEQTNATNAFAGRLDLSKLVLAGHSFGGCTVLAASALKSLPVSPAACVAYDPAVDWCLDGVREYVWGDSYRDGKPPNPKPANRSDPLQPEKLRKLPLLLLYSEVWAQWDSVAAIARRTRENAFGQGSIIKYIRGSTHNSLADLGMLLPAWLLRQLGMIGPTRAKHVNQLQREITVKFLADVLKRGEGRNKATSNAPSQLAQQLLADVTPSE